jgi:hypothetical protein
MKLSILLFLVFACGLAFGQQNISELTSTAKEATSELEYIYDLDVFSYYNLMDYDTELKKSVFLKSEEGQNKLNDLKSIKAEMQKTTYYVKLSHKFTGLDYDIQKKGFNILFMEWANVALSPSLAEAPKSIKIQSEETNDKSESRILLKSLPTKRVDRTEDFNTYRNRKVEGIYSNELFISMTEESALEVENDRENTDLYFFLTPNGRENSIFKSFATEKWNEITRNSLKADKVRIVVVNSSSSKILFDKSFSYQAPTTK